MDRQSNNSRICFVALTMVSATVMCLSIVTHFDPTDGVDPNQASVDGKGKTSNASASRRPIVRLKSRGHIVTVFSNSSGPSFGLSSDDGKVIAANLSTLEFETQYPELYEMYNTSYAGASSGRSLGIGDSASKLLEQPSVLYRGISIDASVR